MRKGKMLLEQLAQNAENSVDGMSLLPIVEIAGEGRVLIENHLGIMGYSRERIMVKVRYGAVSVCGRCLELLRMTQQQLVICGKIESVMIHRRELQ